MKINSNPFFGIPHTKIGWWSVGLAAASIVFILSWSVLPGGAILGFLSGLVGGILSLIAVIRQNERSWLVFLSILPLFWVLIFILGEFLVPH
jgi:threonine/homoserine efflux transporter RhtA